MSSDYSSWPSFLSTGHQADLWSKLVTAHIISRKNGWSKVFDGLVYAQAIRMIKLQSRFLVKVVKWVHYRSFSTWIHNRSFSICIHHRLFHLSWKFKTHTHSFWLMFEGLRSDWSLWLGGVQGLINRLYFLCQSLNASAFKLSPQEFQNKLTDCVTSKPAVTFFLIFF